VELNKVIELLNNNKAILFHQRMKSQISLIQKREFLEKKIKFKQRVTHVSKVEGDALPNNLGIKHTMNFIFFSSVPDSMMEIENGVTRATVILGIHMFEKLEDGRLRF